MGSTVDRRVSGRAPRRQARRGRWCGDVLARPPASLCVVRGRRRVAAVAERPPEGRHRRGPSASGCDARSGVGVVDGGEAIGRPGLDVVALAAFERHVAARMHAVSVANFQGPSHGASEPTGPSEVDDPRRSVEHDPFDQRLVHRRRHGARGDDRAVAELADPALEGLVTHRHADERPGALAVHRCSRGPAGHLHERVVSRCPGVRARWQTVADSPCSARAAAQGGFSQVAAR